MADRDPSGRSPSGARRRFQLVLLAAVIVAGCSSPSSSSSLTSADAARAKEPPTLIELQKDIADSVNTNAPDLRKAVPPLARINTNYTTRWTCYSGGPVPADPARECSWGDASASASRTMLLYGDSNAAMWLPALDVVGKGLGWRVVFLAVEGCQPWTTPWLAPSTVLIGAIAIKTCNSWRRSVEHFVGTYKPAVVIPVGVGPFGTALNFPPDHATLTTSIVSLVRKMGSLGSQVMFLKPMPRFEPRLTQVTPTLCLTVHGNNLGQCYSYLAPAAQAKLWGPQAIKAAATITKSLVVDTSKLFCTSRSCALFVKHAGLYHLVFIDRDHMTRDYSTWIGPALRTLMAPLLTTYQAR